MEHSQQVAHADGRHDDAAIAPFLFDDGAEQIAGEIIVVTGHLALGCSRWPVLSHWRHSGGYKHRSGHYAKNPESFHISQIFRLIKKRVNSRLQSYNGLFEIPQKYASIRESLKEHKVIDSQLFIKQKGHLAVIHSNKHSKGE
jgi:hypothetical protein